MASYLSPEPKHVIVYHLVTEGRGYAHIEDDTKPVPLEAGEIVVFPHGHTHILGNGAPIVPVDSAKELQRIMSEDLKIYRHGGGGELTRIICAYLAFEPQLIKILLSGLPPSLKVTICADASGEWLENSLRYSVDNSEATSHVGETVLAELSEVLFIETLRIYIE